MPGGVGGVASRDAPLSRSLALFGPDGSNWRCPFMRAKRTSQMRTQTSEFDPFETCRSALKLSAFRGRLEVTGALSE